jgi:hypothetical protein
VPQFTSTLEIVKNSFSLFIEKHENSMSFTIPQPSINDIKTKAVIFYEDHPDPIKFCKERDISTLPSKEHIDYLYKINRPRTRFDKIRKESSKIISNDKEIFNPTTIGQIQCNEIVFTEDSAGKTSGIIHFSDYNHISTSTFLYYKLNVLEQDIRKLLIKRGCTDDNLIDHIRKKSKNTYRLTEICQMKWNKIHPFSRFYLKELIDFLHHNKITSIPVEIIQLRNKVMHMHEFITKKGSYTNNMIYDKSSFIKFTDQVDKLLNLQI